jgi:hypothetical protein
VSSVVAALWVWACGVGIVFDTDLHDSTPDVLILGPGKNGESLGSQVGFIPREHC